MLLSDFPCDLTEYFKIQSDHFGDQYFPLNKEKPWFFTLGMWLFTQFHPDEAVRRMKKPRWEDLRALYGLQIARSHKAESESDQESHFMSVCGQNLTSRDFGQLPCTVKSIKFRSELIEKRFKKNDPILILGDDDALSVALASKGFTDITVFEIDEKVVRLLQRVTSRFPNKPTIVQQDILKSTPVQFNKNYALITFDPWYAIDGLQSFVQCGLNVSRNSYPEILLSFNSGILLGNFPLFYEYLHSIGYGVELWSPLSNTYPIPDKLNKTLKFADTLASILSLKNIFKLQKPKKMFFSSDLLILRKNLS